MGNEDAPQWIILFLLLGAAGIWINMHLTSIAVRWGVTAALDELLNPGSPRREVLLKALREAQQAGPAYLGAQVLDSVDGVVIGVVVDDSPAQRGGLHTGALVKKVDAQPLSSADELIEKLDRLGRATGSSSR
jgi:S1-C subfamily serine protease